MARLQANGEEIARFAGALFRYASSDTFVALRGFTHEEEGKARVYPSVHVNGSLDPVVAAAVKAATEAANSTPPVVFCPPICTFKPWTDPKDGRRKIRVRVEDLVDGLALSVEIDEGNAHALRARLESLLGAVTVAVASGGEWTDPDTGEVHAKLHLHWRLSEPTATPEEHARLRQARDFACRLIGADPTGKPIVHPLRWPGSWHTKGKPKLCRIVALNDGAEINLDEALDALSEAVEAAGLAGTELPQSSEPGAAVPLVAAAMAAIPNNDEHYDTWIRYGYACFRAAGSEDGYGIWEAWSRKSAKFNADQQAAAWNRIHKAILGSSAPRTIGAGTIFFMARQNGWQRPEPEPPPTPDDPGWWTSMEAAFTSQAESPEPAPAPEPDGADPQIDARVIDPSKEWLTPAPLREWIIEGWIPRGYVTGLYGDGGIGKSLLCQQLLSSVALGLPWLGLTVRAGRAYGMMCEDDNKELHRRQEAINRAYQVQMQNLELLRIHPRLGFDNLLMTFDQFSHPHLTELFAGLCKFLDQFPPTLVVLDTLADIFGGNEISRVHARSFVQGVGGRIARRWNCGVVIAAHPSASGLATGSGTSGNTAWNNTFRSRLYMTRPEKEEEGDLRMLSRMKANYAPRKAEITFHWDRGCFVEGKPRDLTGESAPAARMEWPHIHAIFDEIDRAWQAKDPWSNSAQTRKHGRYFPLWAQVHRGLPEKMVARYLETWLAGGYLAAEIVNTRTKERGLRVAQRLQPPVDSGGSAEVDE